MPQDLRKTSKILLATDADSINVCSGNDIVRLAKVSPVKPVALAGAVPPIAAVVRVRVETGHDVEVFRPIGFVDCLVFKRRSIGIPSNDVVLAPKLGHKSVAPHYESTLFRSIRVIPITWIRVGV